MIKINLLPPAESVSLPIKKVFLISVVALMGVLVSIFCYHTYQIWALQQGLRGLEHRYVLLRPTEQKMNQANRTLQLIHNKEELMANLTKQNISVYALAARLEVVTPKRVWLTEVLTSEKAGITMKGFSMSLPDVAEFMDNLEADVYFYKPVLISAQEDTKQQVINFEINVQRRGL